MRERSADGGIMVSENEMNRLARSGDNARLYIAVHCRSEPELFRVQNPARPLRFEMKTKGGQ